MKLRIAMGAAVLALATLAHAQDAAPQETGPQVDPNYGAMLSAALQIQAVQAQARIGDAQARAACYAAISALATSTSGTDVSRVAGVVALGMSCAGGANVLGAAQQNAGFSIPAPPPTPVKVESGNWMQALINAPAALFEGAVKIAPSIVQYLLGRANAESNTKIALAGSAERGLLYQTFGQIHGQTANMATQGFISIGQIPQGSVYTVNGSGVNFGSGALTFNPVTGSYNPTRDCRGGTAAAGGNGGSGAAAAPGGGAAGPGGGAPGGTC